ncbi:MAG: nucleotide exchange factor GrpE [Rubrobacter sp.]|nr:nucleotide exchange factor GrpE [Rubrobacter sp.]
MSSEEQHRWEGEPLGEGASPREDTSSQEERSELRKQRGEEAPPAEQVVPEPLELGEDLGVPEVEGEEEEPETDPEEEAEIAREEILALAEELEAVREERDEYLENARRMKAELDNSPKRQERERARLVQLASERLIRELLPVLDNLERALEVEGDIREGVQATRDQLVAVLGQEGLAPVASDGESFDPAVHEAVMGQPSEEHEEDTIIQTLERGYVLNGKPIRPAKVIVSKQV